MYESCPIGIIAGDDVQPVRIKAINITLIIMLHPQLSSEAVEKPNFLRFSFVLAVVIGLHILKRLYSFAQPTVNLCQLTIDALLVRSI